MKNRVGLEGYGEILAGRIARPYEKGTPRAKQGDEYWFFIKHFASISREKASRGRGDGDGGSERKERKDRRERSERKGGEAQPSLLCFFTQRRRDVAEAGWLAGFDGRDGCGVSRRHIGVRGAADAQTPRAQSC